MEPRIRYARTSDGADIAYGVIGSGPPVLVVRALMRLAVDDELAPEENRASGSAWISPWLAFADEHTIVIWDPRGFGLSAGSEPQYTHESSLRDTEAVVNALQLDRFDLLGHMSPVHAALTYAAHHPERVRRLALWNPAPPGSSMRSSTLAGLPDILHSHFLEYLQLAALRSIGWARGIAGQRWVEYTYRQFTPESWERVMMQMEQLDATPELHNVSCLTLIIDDTSLTPIWPWAGGAGHPGGVGVPRTEAASRYAKRLASQLTNGELTILKSGAKQTYGETLRRFFAADEEPDDAAPS